MIARARFQLVRRTVSQQAALADNHGTRADCTDFFEDMGGNHNNLVAAFGQLLNQPANLMLLVWVQTIGGLVQNQHLRVVQNGLGQTDPALEPFGQRLDALAEHVLQFDLLNGALHLTLALGTSQATNTGDKFKEALDAHVAVTGRTFRQIAHLLLRQQRLGLNIEAADRRRTAIRRQKSGQHLHGGGLAGPVGPEKTEHFTRLDVKRQIVDGDVIAEAFGQAVYAYHAFYYSPRMVFRAVCGWLLRPAIAPDTHVGLRQCNCAVVHNRERQNAPSPAG